MDVGCAFGQWVYWMRKAGAKSLGIDIAIQGVEFGRKKLGLDLRKATLESLEEPDNTFDVIVMTDLIEHIANLHSFMSHLTALLKPNGLVFVQTPNWESYWKWSSQWQYLNFGLEHLLYFDVNSLDNLFGRYGMLPTRKTSVMQTIPCDTRTYIKTRKSIRFKLRSFLTRLPECCNVVHLLCAKLLRRRGRVYIYDDSRQKGALILGCYRKQAERP